MSLCQAFMVPLFPFSFRVQKFTQRSWGMGSSSDGFFTHQPNSVGVYVNPLFANSCHFSVG